MRDRKRVDVRSAPGPVELLGRRDEWTPAAGYSLLELERAGLTVEQARDRGIPLDLTRTNGVGANVLQLRRTLASS